MIRGRFCPLFFLLRHKNKPTLNTTLMNLSTSLSKNEQTLKQLLVSDDLSFTPIKIGETNGLVVFAKDLIDKELLGQLIIRPAYSFKGVPDGQSLEKTFFSPEKQKFQTIKETVDEVVFGNAVLLCDGVDFSLSFGIKKFEQRAIMEPPTSTVIKGPREGFVESLPVNVSLIRRRIKSPHLIFENSQIGRFSQTTVTLCYIDNVADKKLVESVKKKLKNINIDAILDSSYVAKYLGDTKPSIFKKVGNTEKPDILVSKIMEGRVALLIDGSPIALTVPYLLLEDFQSPSDYYNSSYSATTARFIRLISVILALLLPALFVSAELFHLQLIPLSFLLTIVKSIKGIPLSPSYEMFFTFLIFEILNEASVRMPRYVGMVVSIVGGLVLGETAVNAGIISPPTLMIIALSGICLYTVPELEQPLSFIRLFFLIIAGSIGVYGIIVAVSTLVIYLTTAESFNAPLLAPFSPLIRKDLKDSFYKGFLTEENSRPASLGNKNKRRMAKETDDD